MMHQHLSAGEKTSRHPMTLAFTLALGVLLSMTTNTLGQPANTYATARERLIQNEIAGGGVKDARVLEAIRTTERHEFVPRGQRHLAYYDMALPIGAQQTISSPFIVAVMTEAIDPQESDRVLEIGTGSGYQAAVLSPLVDQIYTVEIVESLGKRAARTLKKMRCNNVHVRIGDGFAGWPEHAPFDKIIVTCAPERIPEPLVEQLKDGGRIVIPVGERYQQTLYLYTKREGKLLAEPLRPTLFVPMTGTAEQRRVVQPDPGTVQVVNGNFEDEPTVADGPIPGWYYQRQLSWVTSDTAPEGDHYARFQNRIPGRASRALQGLLLDGSRISRIRLEATVKTARVMAGPERDMLPMVAVTLYDDQRRELGSHWLGPWKGASDWQTFERTIRVPSATREAILRVGLFGATGELSVDHVSVVPVRFESRRIESPERPQRQK